MTIEDITLQIEHVFQLNNFDHLPEDIKNKLEDIPFFTRKKNLPNECIEEISRLVYELEGELKKKKPSRKRYNHLFCEIDKIDIRFLRKLKLKKINAVQGTIIHRSI